MQTVQLTPHPEATTTPALALSVHCERRGERLWLRYVVEGALNAVRWPSPATPERADRLWTHTCFEAFVRTPRGYCEFNVSPSSQWASYRFNAYRQGMEDAAEAVVVGGLDFGDDYFVMETWIDLPAGAERIGLSAVIEDIDGGVTYWALAHPSDKPDFHHPDSFVLDMPAPEPS